MDQSHSLQSSEDVDWRIRYIDQLQLQLVRAAELVKSASSEEVQCHGQSLLTLLREAHHYAVLKPDILRLIKQLNPLPIRWGWGSFWAVELDFALTNLDTGNVNLQAEYRCDLAEIYMPVGRFEDAIRQAEVVIHLGTIPLILAARALKILFNGYRSTGLHYKADQLMVETNEIFKGDLDPTEVTTEIAQAWIMYKMLRLECMREQGKLEEGLELVDQLIWLDQREGSKDQALTAELVTFRSTLRWETAQYQSAVSDLQFAIELYAKAGDHFNSESLYSNLGLVYWNIGELDNAEKALTRAIDFYHRTGSEQLATYDIGNLGLTYFARGNLAKALNLVLEHIDHSKRLNFITELNRGKRNLPKILFYQGQIEPALEELKASIPYFEKRGSRYSYYLNYLWMGQCYKALGRLDIALSDGQMVNQWCQDNNKPPVFYQLVLRCLADFLPLEEQEPLLLESLDLARRLGRILEEAAVLLLLGRAAHNSEEGLSYWKAGSKIMRRMGAGTWLKDRTILDPPFFPMFL